MNLRKYLSVIVLLIITLLICSCSDGGHKHDLSYDIGFEATCTEDGLSRGSHCDECGEVFSEQKVIPALGHDYQEIVVNPTCTENGYIKHQCSRCDDFYLDEIISTGHKINIVETPATCKEEGLRVTKCYECDLYIEDVLPVLDHTESEWIIDKKATCEEDGEKHTICTVCNDEINREVIPALKHNYAYKVYEPTCLDDGRTFFYCLNCGHNYYGNETEATGHDFESYNEVLTCTTDGCTLNSCKNCDLIERTNITKATGHNFDYEIGSCISCGKLCCEDLIYELDETSSGYYVVGIKDTVETDIIVPAKFNELPVIGVKQQAFDNFDNIISITLPNTIKFIDKYAFYDCDSLEYLYINSNNLEIGGPRIIYYCDSLVRINYAGSHISWVKLEIELNEQVEVECELGHKYELISESHATCEQEGILIFKCYHCNDTYEVYEEALGHSIDEENSYIEPTCTEVGYKGGICTVCGHDSTVEIEALGHNIEYEVITEATCIQNGLEKGVCIVCEHEEERIIKAHGHNASDIIGEGEKCGSKEIGYIFCLTCREKLYEFGHVYEKTIVEATCETDGYRLFSCVNCEHEYKEVIKAIDHVRGDIIVHLDATCEEEGIKHLLCGVCNTVLSEFTFDKYGHVYESKVENEFIVYTCTICMDVIKVKIEESYYTITFETNGGEKLSDLIVNSGSDYSVPEPTREGYEFAGWYLDKEFNNLYMDNEPIMSDITLYAYWVEESFIANMGTNTFEENVELNYTFEIYSEILLDNDNVKSYVTVYDTDNKLVNIKVLLVEENIYEVYSEHYIEGGTYHVILTDEVSFINRYGNELWFTTRFEEYVDIVYKDGVIQLYNNDVISYYTENDIIYIYTYEDLLNVGNVGVIIGEKEYYILAAFEVTRENIEESYYSYECIGTTPEDVFEKCDIYVQDAMDFSNIDVTDIITDEYRESFIKSPLYKQINDTIEVYSRQKNDYYLKAPSIKPVFKFVENGIKAGFNVSFLFEHKVNKSYVKVTFQVTDTISAFTNYNGSLLAWNLTGSIKVVNTFAFDVIVAIGYGEEFKESESEVKKIYNIIKKLKSENDYSNVDSDPASSEFRVPIVTGVYWGPVRFDLYITSEFQAVGQLGIQYTNGVSVSAGFKLEKEVVRKSFKIFGKKVYYNDTVKKISAFGTTNTSSSISVTLLGKIRYSVALDLEVSLGVPGIFNLGVNAKAGPYYEIAGFISGTIDSDKGGSIAGGMYAEGGLFVEIVAFLEFLGKDLEYEIFNKDFPIVAQGKPELAIGFEELNEQYKINMNFNDILDLNKIVNLRIKHFDFKDLIYSYKKLEGDYKFYIYGDKPEGLTLNSNGKFTIVPGAGLRYIFDVKVVCGSFTKVISLFIDIDHFHLYEETVISSGCLVTNISDFVCECGHEYRKTTNAPGHSMIYISHQDATCTIDGHTEGKYCENCDYVEIQSTTITAKGHQYTEWNIVDPTCTEDGYKVRSCTVCKEEFKETLSALKHIEVIDKGHLPTCEEPGLTDGKHCSRCKEVLVEQTIINSNGHTEVTDKGYDPTCENPGLTDGKHCSTCNKVLIKQDEIESLGHIEVVIEKQEATCEEDGYEEWKYCSRCEKVLVVKVIIKALGHTEIIDKGHPATCEEAGLTDGKHCDVCKKVLEEQVEIKALGHTEVIDKGYAATCEEPGLTDGKHCDVCKKVLEEQVEIKALGHTEVIDKGYAATCEEPGLTDGKHCDVCKKVLEEQVEIVAFNHAWEELEVIVSNCQERKVNKQCELCKIIREFQEEIIASHNFINGVCDTCGFLKGSEGIEYVLMGDNTYQVKSMGTCNDTNVIISSTYENLPVTSIGTYAFKNCTNIENIIIPNSIIIINEYAFYGCSGLKEISIPNSVTQIGQNSFRECNNLSKIVLPFIGSVLNETENANLGYIFGRSSYIPSSLKEVIVTGGTIIGNNAFYNCTNLTNIELPNTIISIGDYAFYNCTNLTNLEIPENVNTIGQLALSRCNNLEKLTIPFIGDLLIQPTKNNIGYLFDVNSYNTKIPASLKEIIITKATTIRNSSFSGCSNITSVNIKSQLEIIESSAFRNCTSLESVSLPNTVRTIGDNAFYYCSSLKNINLPESITTLGQSVFDHCTSIETIELPSKIQTISLGLFNGCSKLGHVIIPDAVISIEQNAFSNCTSLTELILPNNLQKMVRWAFNNCENLENIYYKGSIEDWCNIVFESENSNPMYYAEHFYMLDHNGKYYELNEINFGEQISEINNYQFYGFDNITKITLSSNIIKIGNYAFSGCLKIEYIYIYNTVEKIGNYAFEYCSRIIFYCEAASKPRDWNSYWNYDNRPVYWGVENIIQIDDCFYIVDSTTMEATLTKCLSNESEINIPNNIIFDNEEFIVSTISDYSLSNLLTLSSVNISKNVKSIGKNVFFNSLKLEKIIVDDENIDYCSINGNLYTKNSNTLIQYAVASNNTEFNIPKTVKTIYDNAFYGNENLKKITISSNIFGYKCLDNCNGLTDLYLTTDVTKINIYFDKCPSLKNVYFSGTVNDWCKIEFSYSGSTNPISVAESFYIFDDNNEYYEVTEIRIPNTINKIGSYAFYGYDKLTSVYIPETIRYIGDWSFSKCVNLIEVNIPSSVTSIGQGAFNNCINLKNINIPDSVTGISPYAFQYCESLRTVRIPASVTYIGQYAFAAIDHTLIVYCESETKPTQWWDTWYSGNILIYWGINDTNFIEIEGIYYYLDSNDMTISVIGCNSEEENVLVASQVQINDNKYVVSTIGSYVFNNCKNLKSIIIPNSVTSIGGYAFANCENLSNVYYEGTEDEWTKIEKASSGNSVLNKSTIYFYNENKPETEGNYWYFDNNNQIVIWTYDKEN